MTDPVFQKFYQNVRDPSWPDIDHYGQFSMLPQKIRDECLYMHSGKQRFDSITSTDYWNNLRLSSHQGWRYKNIVFLPIKKCGYVYYTNLFGDRLKWESCKLTQNDFDRYSVVSCLIHPLTRYLKGVTEWIWNNRHQWSVDLLMELMMKNSQLVFTDMHSAPLSLTYPGVINQMTLIPADIWPDDQTRSVLMEVFQLLGHPEIVLPLKDQRLHQSREEKIKIFDKLKQFFLAKPNSELLLHYQIFAQDLCIYKQTVDKFSR
jgi:hypothetical protein